MAAYNFRLRLKPLRGLAPYEYIRKIWTAEPEKFILNPTYPEQNTFCFTPGAKQKSWFVTH